MEEDSEVRITLRLPASLRDSLTASADANSRSMNGEIVSRLSDSFDEERIAQLMRERAVNRDKHILYVVLDADGLPISWQEIMTHLGEIGRSTGRDINSIEARIFDAEFLANDLREEFWWELVQKYRKARKSAKTEPRRRQIQLPDDE